MKRITILIFSIIFMQVHISASLIYPADSVDNYFKKILSLSISKMYYTYIRRIDKDNFLFRRLFRQGQPFKSVTSNARILDLFKIVKKCEFYEYKSHLFLILISNFPGLESTSYFP